MSQSSGGPPPGHGPFGPYQGGPYPGGPSPGPYQPGSPPPGPSSPGPYQGGSLGPADGGRPPGFGSPRPAGPPPPGCQGGRIRPRINRRGVSCAEGCGTEWSDMACCLVEAFLDGLVVGLMLALSPSSAAPPRGGAAPRGPVARRLYRAVRCYQVRVSPRRPPRCRFSPTCSEYAAQALQRHGAVRGCVLVLRRLARCRPGGARGADPVPA